MIYHFRGAAGRSIVVVRVPLQRESGGGMPGEGLEIPYRLSALGEERQVGVPEVVESDGGGAPSYLEGTCRDD